MKQWIVLFLLIFYSVSVSSQSSLYKGHNALHPNNLIVNYVVCFQPAEYDGYSDSIVKNGPYSSFQLMLPDLKYIITDSTLFGKIPVYNGSKEDAFFPYCILDNRERVPQTEVGSLLNEKSIVEMDGNRVSLIRKVISPEEVKGFEFIEEWEWNPSNVAFTKKVVGYNPILVYSDDKDKIRKKKTFYILDTCFLNNKKTVVKAPLLAAKIKYEFYLDKGYCDKINMEYADVSMPFKYHSSVWSETTQSVFIQLLCQPVLDGTVDVFDFVTNEKLTHQQAKERLGVRMDSVQVMDYVENNTKTAYVLREFEPEKIKSVIFIEDWYIDKNSLMISKKVIGIAPVLFDGEETETTPVKKTVPFVVYFMPHK
jgi:hypothetical protein